MKSKRSLRLLRKIRNVDRRKPTEDGPGFGIRTFIGGKMTDQDINAILKVVSNLSDAIIETQERQQKIIDALSSHNAMFKQIGAALINHKEYMETSAKMIQRIVLSLSDPTLADDLDRITKTAVGSVKPAEEEVPPKELLN
jgi:ABC-type transporter Mla subunit MlaD